MSTPGNTQQSDQETQALTDENLEEISGGVMNPVPGAPDVEPSLNTILDSIRNGGPTPGHVITR